MTKKLPPNRFGSLSGLRSDQLALLEEALIDEKENHEDTLDGPLRQAAEEIRELAKRHQIKKERGFVAKVFLEEQKTLDAGLQRESEAKHREFLEKLDDFVFEMQLFPDEQEVDRETKQRILGIVQTLKEADDEDLDETVRNCTSELLLLKRKDGMPVIMGKVLYANEMAERELQFPRGEFLGKISMLELVHSEDMPIALTSTLELLHEGERKDQEFRLRKQNGELVDVSINSHLEKDEYPYVIQGVARNIEERKKSEELEKRLQQAQKMELLGQLAAGVAHDLNNGLMPITTGAELALRDLDLDHPLVPELRQIGQAGERMAGTVRSLLDFAAQRELKDEMLDLRLEIPRNERLFKRIVTRDNVSFTCEIAPDIHRVKMDSSALNRILMNLVINANDAMPGGGEVKIEASNSDEIIPESEKEGMTVQIRVSDTGTGIPKELIGKIFEPFYTTKGPDKGTGLGLAQVFGLVKKSGGTIAVKSEVGKGTDFTILLPVHEVALGEASGRKARFTEILEGSGSILMVEDDQAVNRATAKALEKSGFAVRAFEKPESALDFVRQSPDEPLDVLITDIVMPGMGGVELAQRVREIRENIEVIFVSGYSKDIHGIDLESSDFLEKPFRVRDVVELLNQKMASKLKP